MIEGKRLEDMFQQGVPEAGQHVGPTNKEPPGSRSSYLCNVVIILVITIIFITVLITVILIIIYVDMYIQVQTHMYVCIYTYIYSCKICK